MNFIILFLWTFSLLKGSFGEEILVQNNCGTNLYVLPEKVNSGPFSLGSGQSRTISVNRGQGGPLVRGRLGCDANGGNCDASNSANYASLAEFHWSDNGMTWYDVSQVNGFDLPITMEPFQNTGGNCRVASCRFNLDRDCPGASKVNGGGRVVGCRNPNRDSPATEYAAAMKRVCPGVYSWSKDDNDGMRACNPGNPGLKVTFC